MLVRDRMSRKVVATTPDAPLTEARATLKNRGIRQLPVLSKQRLAGILTDRDVRSAPVNAKKVKDVMTKKPFVISADAAVDEAARLLRVYKIGALPVVEKNRLCGIITASDILDAFVDLSGVAESTCRVVIAPGAGKQVEARIRRIIDHCHGELKWMHRDSRKRSGKIHLRLKARRLDDVITELEAAGFEVVSVVSQPRRG